MSALLALLATSLGKYILMALAAVIAVGGAMWRSYAAGKKSERAKQAADQLDAIQKRKETNDEVNSLGPADIDSHLSKWLRDK